MEVVSMFDGREIADIFYPELQNQLLRFGISIKCEAIVSEMMRTILEDHLTSISSWVRFTVHPVNGVKSTYTNPSRCKDTLNRLVELELNRVGLTMSGDMEVTWGPVSLLLSAQLTRMMASVLLPGYVPTVKTWDVYVVEAMPFYCGFKIVNLGDYRIAEWQQMVEERAMAKYGDMEIPHEGIRVMEQGYGDFIESIAEI